VALEAFVTFYPLKKRPDDVIKKSANHTANLQWCSGNGKTTSCEGIVSGEKTVSHGTMLAFSSPSVSYSNDVASVIVVVTR
jgi:hypothetical protein